MRNRAIVDKIDWIKSLQTLMTKHPDAKEGIEELIADVKREIRKMYKTQEDPLEKSLLQGGKRAVQNDPESTGYYTFWLEPDDPDRSYEETIEYVESEYSYPCRCPGAIFVNADFRRTELGLWIITWTDWDI